jgi:tRNA A37 threonylcarbamoyladenosine biosynthesis protein TsaE
MQEDHRKRLDSIKDEVNELHPLLKLLLPEMPDVKKVEYTHGSNEMGADFLLSRWDDTFDQLDYIGVVAKIGKIEQAQTPDIERQIKECFIPKLFNSGKEEIDVSEVWVVTTGSVSHNAKIKIRHEYQGRKITFISGDKLESLVTKYAPNFWTDVPIAIGGYLNKLRIRNDQLDHSLSLARDHSDVYVEQDIQKLSESDWQQKPDHRKKTKFDIFDSVTNEKVILVEGDMGAGKSKLLRQLVRRYTDPQRYVESAIVPILISYKALLDNYQADLKKVIEEFVQDGALKDLDEKSQFLFLIDAVDEKNLALEAQLSEVSKLVEGINNTPEYRAVITSRKLGSFKENREHLKKCLRVELKPMSVGRIIEFVQKLCSGTNLSKRIFEDLKKSHLFRELPRSPIAAILLANLLQENAHELPSTMTELYSKYLELVLGRWDIDKGLQTQKEYQALDNILMRIAAFVIENELHYLSIQEVKGMIEDYLKPRNLGIKPDRLFWLLTERSHIIVLDPGEGRLCFKHRTFAEYFYAKSKLLDRSLVVDHRAFQPYWRNVFFFFVGQIKDCPDLLESLSQMEPTSSNEMFLKMVNMGNYYMAGFTSPYDVVERGLAKVVKDAAIFYLRILNKEIDVPLSGLPEMHLLWLFQMVLRDSYAFDHFGKAVETAVLEIDADSTLDTTTKVFALFFLSVIYIDLGLADTEAFDAILRNHAKELPLSIQLGIQHVADKSDLRGTLLRHHERQLKKAMRGNKILHAQMEGMYKRPIRSLKQIAAKDSSQSN